LTAALAKLETQAVKQRGKWRETHRRGDPPKSVEQAPARAEAAPKASKRVYRVNGAGRRKPITLEEAMLEIGPERDYLVYRDADNEAISVLIRRRDGDFDLIES
jgi:putative sigma-54 modulation protein